MSESLYFWMANWKTEDSAPDDSNQKIFVPTYCPYNIIVIAMPRSQNFVL
jgi:hypothetical protein